MRVPPGFTVRELGRTRHLVAPPGLVPALLAAGLDQPETRLREREPGPGTGRGPRAVVELPGGERVLVKQYLRGGVFSRLNRDRYLGARRFLRELATGARLRAAGLPVGETRAVVLDVRGAVVRAWGVARFIPGAPDLARWFTGELAGGEAERLWRAALALLERFAAAGLWHPDLNLGNVLARRAGDRFELWLVDLDRAWLLRGPLPAVLHRAGRRRLVRSFRKITGGNPPGGA